MKSCELRMYVGLHWIYITADTSSTIAAFLKGFAVFLEASVGSVVVLNYTVSKLKK